ncbi:MAG: glycine cleavage system protein GcvH [Thermofilaceae archaeon]
MEPLMYKGYSFPRDRKYSEKHSWIKVIERDTVRVGITDYAQKKLKAVVFIEPPEVGVHLNAGDLLATLESIKVVSEVYAPLSGIVVTYNSKLDDDPGLLNRDPYGEGWIAELKPDNPTDVEKLLSADEYADRIVKKEES